MNEIEEFFSYVEVPQVLEHKAAFQETWTFETGAYDLQIALRGVLSSVYLVQTLLTRLVKYDWIIFVDCWIT